MLSSQLYIPETDPDRRPYWIPKGQTLAAAAAAALSRRKLLLGVESAVAVEAAAAVDGGGGDDDEGNWVGGRRRQLWILRCWLWAVARPLLGGQRADEHGEEEVVVVENEQRVGELEPGQLLPGQLRKLRQLLQGQWLLLLLRPEWLLYLLLLLLLLLLPD